jgi:hypothetical protein
MANAPSMQGQYPQQADKKYWTSGTFNQALYQNDLMRYQASLSTSQMRPDVAGGTGGTLADIYSTKADGVGAGQAPSSGPAGIGAVGTFPATGGSSSQYGEDVTPQKDQSGLLPGHPDYGGPGQPSKTSSGGTSTTPASPGSQSSGAISNQRSPNDDSTNDGGSNWSLGPGWKAVTDPELRAWSPEHQAAAQAAHDAHDEAGFNGVKDYVRNERATGGSNYRGGANAGYNPNNTPDSAYAGMSLKDVLALGGDQDYYGELSTFSQPDQQDWITAYMRGATQQGQQIVDKNRKK